MAGAEAILEFNLVPVFDHRRFVETLSRLAKRENYRINRFLPDQEVEDDEGKTTSADLEASVDRISFNHQYILTSRDKKFGLRYSQEMPRFAGSNDVQSVDHIFELLCLPLSYPQAQLRTLLAETPAALRFHESYYRVDRKDIGTKTVLVSVFDDSRFVTVLAEKLEAERLPT